MFTLIFLLCTAQGCNSVADKSVFENKDQCEVMAIAHKQRALNLVEQGMLEPHSSAHQCVEWGTQI
jgi:hypothetical protein